MQTIYREYNQMKIAKVSLADCLILLSALAAGLIGCGGGGGGNNGGGGIAPSATMISSGAINGQLPKIAMDGSGNAMAIWQENEVAGAGTVSANYYKAGLGWGNPSLVSTVLASGTSDPQISMNSIGYGIAAWVQGNGTNTMIYANRYAPGSGWRTSNLISSSSSFVANPSVAIDRDGNAIAVWDQGDTPPRNIHAARYDSISGWTPPTLISSGVYGAYKPRIAVTPSGKAFVSFQEYDGTNDKIIVRSFDTTAGWGPRQVVSHQPASAGSNAYDSAISVNSVGAVMVAWNHPGYMGRREIHGDFYTNTLQWFHASDYPISVMNPYPSAGNSYYSDVAADENSDHMVVWGQTYYGQTDIYASCFWHNAPGGAYWTTPARISIGTGSPQLPKVAKYPNGDAVVTWEQFDGTTRNIYINSYIYSTTAPYSGWDNAVRVNDISNDCNSPAIAVSQTGDAIVVWSQRGAIRNNIYAIKIR